MTILALGLGALLAAARTRLAAGAFIGAAVAAAVGDDLAAIGTWTAALIAGWVLLERGPIRPLALPAAGACAVVAAGLVQNGAVVLGFWVMATGAAAAATADTDEGRRWGTVLCCLDLLLVAAVATTVVRGFEGWPATLRGPGAILLLIAAVLRAPVAAGPSDTMAAGGLFVVRAQAAVLASAAISMGPSGVAEAAIVVASAGFAVAPFARRRAVVDVVQELSLVALALAAARLGFGARGWEWGALGAGTLIHHLRLTVGRGAAGQWPDALLRSAGLGLPFLPVIAALVEGVLPRRGWPAAVMAGGLLLGLAGRTRTPKAPAVRSRSRRRSVLEDVRGPVVVALAAVAASWAAALSLPRPPGGTAVGWPPAWAVALVVVAGAGGSVVTRVVSPPRRDARDGRAPWRPPWTGWLPRLEIPARPQVLWGALGALAAAAIAMWLVGLSRGFL